MYVCTNPSFKPFCYQYQLHHHVQDQLYCNHHHHHDLHQRHHQATSTTSTTTTIMTCTTNITIRPPPPPPQSGPASLLHRQPSAKSGQITGWWRSGCPCAGVHVYNSGKHCFNPEKTLCDTRRETMFLMFLSRNVVA